GEAGPPISDVCWDHEPGPRDVPPLGIGGIGNPVVLCWNGKCPMDNADNGQWTMPNPHGRFMERLDLRFRTCIGTRNQREDALDQFSPLTPALSPLRGEGDM